MRINMAYVKITAVMLTVFLCMFQNINTIIVHAQFSDPDFEEQSTQIDFNGTYTNTEWNIGNQGVSLINSSVSGVYESPVYDIGETVDWQSFEIDSTQFDQAQELDDFGGNAGPVLMNDNILLYHFNESATATVWADTSDGLNDGFCGFFCPFGGASGVFGNAIEFDGFFGAYLVADDFSIKGQDQFTISVWLNPSETFGSRPIYSESIESLFGTDRFRFDTTDGFLRARARFGNTGGPWDLDITSNLSIPQNQWTHVAFTFDAVSDQHIFYVNGLSESFSAPASAFPNTDPSAFTKIGANSGIFGRRYIGLMDDYAIWSRILTPSEIQAISSVESDDLTMQIRTCLNVSCSGVNYVGPLGVGGASDVFEIGDPSSTFSLPQSDFQNARFYQYIIYYEPPAIASSLKSDISRFRIGFNRPTSPELSFAIRSADGQSYTNSCDLGLASVNSTSVCDYRVWVNSSASSGYVVYVRVDGPLSSDSYAIQDAQSGLLGGDQIDSFTAGSERYGIVIDEGLITGGSINKDGQFDAGSNAVGLNQTVNTPILTANGENLSSISTNINSSKVEHRLNISNETPPGTYTQRVTYSVVPLF